MLMQPRVQPSGHWQHIHVHGWCSAQHEYLGGQGHLAKRAILPFDHDKINKKNSWGITAKA